MNNYHPQGKLTDAQWQELLGIEYTITHYPKYYTDHEYDMAVVRLQELRIIKTLNP